MGRRKHEQGKRGKGRDRVLVNAEGEIRQKAEKGKQREMKEPCSGREGSRMETKTEQGRK